MASKRQIIPTTVPNLTQFEGRDVIGSSVAITRAGDGLSQSLAVEPTDLHLGSTVYVVLECTVGKVRFEPVPDTSALRRVHTLVTTTATTVDKELVADLLEAQRVAIEKARGVTRLPFDPADDAEIVLDDDGTPLE